MKQYLPLKKTALAVALGLSSLLASAQAPVVQWDKTFGGNLADGLNTITQTSDGGYILGGWSQSGISGDKTQALNGFDDLWIVKLDASGNKLWDKAFGGNGYDILIKVSQTMDGGYILGGWSTSDISGDKSQNANGPGDFWVVKLDPNGNKIWDKTIGGNGIEILGSIAQTTDGGYILGGVSTSDASGDKTQNSRGLDDYWVVKLDPNGNKFWDKTFGGSNVDVITSLVQTTDGGYILGGTSNSGQSGDKTQPAKGSKDYWVVKLNAAGNQLWDKTIGGSMEDELQSILQTTDGGYILGGISGSHISGDKTGPSRGLRDYWVAKLDASGNKIWDKTLGGLAEDRLKNILQTADGGYIAGGDSNSGIAFEKSEVAIGSNDFWIVKLNAGGTKQWDKTIGGGQQELLPFLSTTADGGYVIGGRSDSGISGNKTQASQGGYDFWMVKLGFNAIGINESTSALKVTVAPNPSQGKFQLQLKNFSAKTAEVTITDLVGRTIYQQEIPVTGTQLTKEINLPAIKGVYLLQIKAGEQITTRKIVIE